MNEPKKWKRGKFFTIADEIMGKPAQFRETTDADLEPAGEADVDERTDVVDDQEG